MVTVPTYGGQQVSARPIMQQGVNVSASPEAFGASAGRGLQQLGAGIQDVGNALAYVQQKDAEARNRDRYNQMQAELNDLENNPETGFLNTMGKSTVDGWKKHQENIRKVIDKYRTGLSGFELEDFDKVAVPTQNEAFDRAARYTGGQRKQWYDESHAAQIETLKNSAAKDYNRPDLVAGYVQRGLSEIDARGAERGWGKEQLDLAKFEFQSQVNSNILLNKMRDDPFEADKWFEQNKEFFTDDARAAALEALSGVKAEAQSIRDMDAFNNGMPAEGGETVREVTAAGQDPIQEVIDAAGPGAGQRKVQIIDETAGKTRSQPVQPQVMSQVSTAASAVGPGIGIVITSGGQAAAGEGGPRTGSTRHDHGGAADIILTVNGKRVLPSENKELYAKFFEEAAAAGMTGLGHYSWGIHVGGGSEAAWGPNTKSNTLDPEFAVAIAKGRARRGSGVQSPASAYEFAQTIKDPARRKAFLTRYETESAIRTEQAKAERDALKQAAFGVVESGGSVDSLSLEQKMQLGREEVEALRSYEAKRAAGPQQDDAALYSYLSELKTEQPEKLAGMSVSELLDLRMQGLTDQTYKEVLKWREAAKTDIEKFKADNKAAKSMLDLSKDDLRALGITTDGISRSNSPEEWERRAKQIADFNRQIEREAQAFKEANKRDPSIDEQRSIVDRLLTPMVWENKDRRWSAASDVPDKFAFEFNGIPDGFRARPAMKYEQIPVNQRERLSLMLMEKKGGEVTKEEVEAFFNNLLMMQQINGRDVASWASQAYTMTGMMPGADASTIGR